MTGKGRQVLPGGAADDYITRGCVVILFLELNEYGRALHIRFIVYNLRVLFAVDSDDSEYNVRELSEEYWKHSLVMITRKTKYVVR